MTHPTCSWHLEGRPPCGKPARPVKVLVVRGPGVGKVGKVDWCLEHEQMFYAEHESEYLN
jgi:hypothetical protein